MNDFALIRKNLFRRRLRASLMIFSILIAFAIYGVLFGFERAFNAGQELAASNRLVTVNKINFTQSMPYAYANRIRGIEGVKQVTHANWFGGYYQDPKNVLITFAVDPASYLEIYRDELSITDAEKQAFLRERTGALVGQTMAEKWGWKVGDRIPVSSNIFSQQNGSRVWDVTIVGIIRPAKPQINTNVMMIQYEYFNETKAFTKDMIGWIVLQTTSASLNDQVAKRIDATFENSTAETSTDTEKAFNKAFMAQLGNIALIVMLVVGAAFVTILMIVGNTMVMSVRERTREIGVLKALGFSGSRILRLVLAESILLALLGGIPGLAIAALIAWTMRVSLSQFVPNLAVTPMIAVVGVLLMVLLGVVTGLVPALNAFRLKIAVALGRG